MKRFTIAAITPLERPDVSLVCNLLAAGASAVLHLGRDKRKADAALLDLTARTQETFGVCFVTTFAEEIDLPSQVGLIIAPFGMNINVPAQARLFRQVHSLEEALMARNEGAHGLIIKGNEGGGKVSDESSFILFQRVLDLVGAIEIWVQGGIGIHNAAGMAASGADGIVLDSQLIAFRECAAPLEIKSVIPRLNGNETKLIDHYRVLVRPNSPALPDNPTRTDLEKWFGSLEIDKGYLPLGQDIALATGLAQRYKKLSQLVFAIREAVHGHLLQARISPAIAPGNAFARGLNIPYPIVQGPMTRVSDVPAFAGAVADAGGLPFIALSLLRGQTARQLIRETRQLAGNRAWGVGILGFISQELLDEQIGYILEEKPPVVLIAGGRPSQAQSLEEAGIKVFLHVPTVALLDMFIREGARNFVFEGRECGGHVGPLSSLVLWESQIERLLQEENADAFSVIFAGGIHDAFSAAFISVMAAPLAIKGIKVGVLMGTAYLYTEEAVTTGAIVRQFQDQAIAHTETILLETAPGHETRCLNSPFAAQFNREKEQLLHQGVDKQEIWSRLESLNVGRLRVAAKGIDRRGESLVSIAEEEQLSEGMFMIGQVAALKHSVITMAQLHKDVAEGSVELIRSVVPATPPRNNSASLDIAIVGMACIYPGARNLDEYWRNIVLGKDAVTEVPDERWNKQLYYDPQSTGGDHSPSKWGGFLPSIDFDPLEFGIPPQSLAAIEPVQLLSLLVAKEALKNAGYADKEFDRENVSVIMAADGGNDLNNNYTFRSLYRQLLGEMPPELDAALPRMTEDSFPGVLANVIAGRICNRLDMGGRNYSVDAACASSLAAVDLACQELQLGKAEMVLAGAADLHNSIIDYLLFSSTHALSRTGRCKTFDSAADGIALGEGVAMLVLKRLEDAKRDGDRVYAVIRGIGGSSDGKSLGLTAPRKRGQWKALQRAYEQAGLSPVEVGLIEAHGTGTVVGDKTELSALTELLIQSGAPAGHTSLGSVKTQIGHTKCAAGLAGIIKAALSVYHGVKPPTLHLQEPNRYYKPDTNPFRFNSEAGPWLDRTRIAGISAFGFGGTNFHAVISNVEDRQATEPKASVIKSWPSELFVFRGDTYAEARTLLMTVRSVLLDNDKLDGKDLAYSLALRNEKAVQLSIVAGSPEDLLLKIDLALSGTAAEGIFPAEKKEGKVAFLFPGQGSQRVNMARTLFTTFPAMRQLLQSKSEYAPIVFPYSVFDEDAAQLQKDQIKDTRRAQPLLGIVDWAIACFLRRLGVEPDMVAGHSYGELPALCFAGVFSPDDLVPLSEKRAMSILDAIGEDKGIMVAVNCPEEMLQDMVSDEKGIYAVNHNSPQQWVLAGATQAMLQLIEELTARQLYFVRLEVACAFHSPLVAGAKALFETALEDIVMNSPSLPVWSNTTASVYPAAPSAIRRRLAEHLVEPVRFSEEITAMYQDGARIFIEVGPGKVLSSLTRTILGKDELVLHTEDKEGITHLLTVIARYIGTGKKINLERLFEDRNARLLDLDHPAGLKRNASVWFVNGQTATPSSGKLPAHGAPPVVEPIVIARPASPAAAAFDQPMASPGSSVLSFNHSSAEQVMIEYLSSIKQLIQAQRDVVLGYFGHTPAKASSSAFPAEGQTLAAPTQNPRRPAAQNSPAAASQPLYPNAAATSYETSGASSQIASPFTTAAETGDRDMKTLLLAIVGSKTGYPPEMLDLDMDMEAELSIDSIKRLEIIGEWKQQLMRVLPELENTDKTMEKIAGVKTLRGLLDCLPARNGPGRPAKHSTGSAPTVQQVENTENKSAGTNWTEEKIRSMLVNVIGEKTGYHPEMLGMEMDLEADLSIDSIKRLEIINELRVRLADAGQVMRQQGNLTEQLTAIKTLNGLVGWIHMALSPAIPSVSRTVTNASAATTAPAAAESAAGMSQASKETLVRLRFELTPSDLERHDIAQLAGRRIAVTDDSGPVAPAIKALLSSHGAIASIVSATDSLSTYEGLIILDIFDSPKRSDIMQCFSMIKQLDPAKIKWVYAVSDFNNHLERNTDPGLLKHFQGYPGFLKSLGREWEQTRCRTIHLNTRLSPGKIASVVLDELVCLDAHSEVFYQDTIRQMMDLVPSELKIGMQPDLHLDRSSVILVLGGAQGITAELMIRFAREYPCHYILVGRSPDPRTGAPDPLSRHLNKDAIRRSLIAQGELKTPAEIEKRTEEIYKRNQILHTIASLEDTGARVDYHSMDLRDEERLRGLIAGLYKRYGRVDGVVHGAGLLEDKLFQHKTPESFERVFSTKVTPLRILEETLSAETQFVILFSSVASVHGNRGQTDYAAANSVLDRYAWALKKKIKGKVMAINWGPWKGTGMVSPSLEKEYERRGISMIPLPEGMETFLNELKYGNDTQVLIMAG